MANYIESGIAIANEDAAGGCYAIAFHSLFHYKDSSINNISVGNKIVSGSTSQSSNYTSSESYKLFSAAFNDRSDILYYRNYVSTYDSTYNYPTAILTGGLTSGNILDISYNYGLTRNTEGENEDDWYFAFGIRGQVAAYSNYIRDDIVGFTMVDGPIAEGGRPAQGNLTATLTKTFEATDASSYARTVNTSATSTSNSIDIYESTSISSITLKYVGTYGWYDTDQNTATGGQFGAVVLYKVLDKIVINPSSVINTPYIKLGITIDDDELEQKLPTICVKGKPVSSSEAYLLSIIFYLNYSATSDYGTREKFSLYMEPWFHTNAMGYSYSLNINLLSSLPDEKNYYCCRKIENSGSPSSVNTGNLHLYFLHSGDSTVNPSSCSIKASLTSVNNATISDISSAVSYETSKPSNFTFPLFKNSSTGVLSYSTSFLGNLTYINDVSAVTDTTSYTTETSNGNTISVTKTFPSIAAKETLAAKMQNVKSIRAPFGYTQSFSFKVKPADGTPAEIEGRTSTYNVYCHFLYGNPTGTISYTESSDMASRIADYPGLNTGSGGARDNVVLSGNTLIVTPPAGFESLPEHAGYGIYDSSNGTIATLSGGVPAASTEANMASLCPSSDITRVLSRRYVPFDGADVAPSSSVSAIGTSNNYTGTSLNITVASCTSNSLLS